MVKKWMELKVDNIKTAITAAMLSQTKGDVLEKYKIFVVVAIHERTDVKGIINFKEVRNYIKDEFGFNYFQVTIIKRIINKYLKNNIDVPNYKRGNFVYREEFKEETKEFNSNKTRINDSLKVVEDELTKYFEKYDKEAKIEVFLEFLEKNGHNLDSSDRINIPLTNLYGGFIFDSQKQDYFKEIEDIYSGILLSNFFHFHIEDAENIEFSDCKIYIDTAILLRFLGLKSKEENKEIQELIGLLDGVHLYCTENVRNELYSSIDGYRWIKKTSGYSDRPLEYFEDKSIEETAFYLENLDKNLSDKGVKIEQLQKIKIKEKEVFWDYYSSMENVYEDSLDESEIFNNLSIGKNYNNKAKECDVASIINIFRVRNKGKRVESLKNCSALLLTSNEKMYKALNEHLKKENISFKVPYVITEEYLATYCFLKNPSSRKLIQKRLIQNAYACSATPTRKFIDDVNIKIKKFVERDNFDKEYVPYLRVNHGLMKNIYKESGGDSDKVNPEFLKSQAEKYSDALHDESNKKYKEELRIKNEMIAKLQDEKKKKNELLAKKIQDERKEAAKKYDNFHNKSGIYAIILAVVVHVLLALAGWVTFNGWIGVAIISALGVIFDFSYNKIIKKLIGHCKMKANEKINKKYEEFTR